MKAWISQDADHRIIWSEKPTYIERAGMFVYEGDCILSYLSPDEHPQYRPAMGECIEVDVDWLEVQE